MIADFKYLINSRQVSLAGLFNFQAVDLIPEARVSDGALPLSGWIT